MRRTYCVVCFQSDWLTNNESGDHVTEVAVSRDASSSVEDEYWKEPKRHFAVKNSKKSKSRAADFTSEYSSMCDQNPNIS